MKDGAPRTDLEVLDLWNDLAIAVRSVEAIAEFTSNVHPDEHVRSLAEEWQQECARLITERDLDRELYNVLAAVDTGELDATGRRLLERSLRDFRRAGVDQSADVRQRLRQIADRSTVLMQEFGRNIRNDVRTIRVPPHRLTGLPDDFIAEHPPGDDGLVALTTEYPDLLPVRTYAADESVRLDLTLAYLNLGWPINDDILNELLGLRAEQAALLGYASWPDFDAETKMIGTGSAIAGFVDEVSELAAPAAQRDIEAMLRRRRQDDPAATGIRHSDVDYYTEVVRREAYGVDAHDLRRYFDFARVRAGLLDVTGRLFGLDYRDVDAPVWHSDVTVHDVHAAATGDLLGRVYLDLHPRPGKFGHAAQFQLDTGVADRQLPEGVLVCNFPTGRMDFDDVITLFHEFGHVIHHIVGGAQRWVAFSGVATELDFIETPSQLIEEWACDPHVLRSFAVDDAGTPIPTELVERMRAAKDFGRGQSTATQNFYAALCYHLHLTSTDDLTGLVRRLQEQYDVLEPIEGTHGHAGFSHLMQYTSAYYSYLWSLVIAKDLFAAFDRTDLLDPGTAVRYRDCILAPGGSRDAAAMVEDFLGRPYSLEPFRQWLTEDGG